MAKKHSVQVLVKARDEASRKFAVIGTSAIVLGKVLKRLGSMTRTVFVEAFRMAKRAVLGLAAAFAVATYAAIKQEAAEVELASALKVTGQYSDETMKNLKERAAAIQDATVYGDEYVLSLMRIALTLGVTADKAGEAAKAAIALHAGFGGGRGKPEIFLRYYIDALRGTGSSLESYVGELRKARTEEERQVIMQKALAFGWDVAKSKAESAGGALMQMKNNIGDIAEVIAGPFLPMVNRAAKAVTEWTKTNEADILFWAKRVHTAVIFVKDVFWDFVDFMKTDWQSGMQWAMDSFLKLLKGAFSTAVTMAIAGGKGIWKGVKEGIFNSQEHKAEAMAKERYLQQGGKLREEGRWYNVLGIPEKKTTVYEDTKLIGQLRKDAQAELQAEKTQSIIGDMMGSVTAVLKKIGADIRKDMPTALKESTAASWEAFMERWDKIVKPSPGARKPGEPAGTPGTFSMAGMPATTLAGAGAKRPGLAFEESRFLTMRRGGAKDYQQQTAKNTQEMIKLQKQAIKKQDELNNKIVENITSSPFPMTNFAH